MADTNAVKLERTLKLNRNYRKTQHAFGVYPPEVLAEWLSQ